MSQLPGSEPAPTEAQWTEQIHEALRAVARRHLRNESAAITLAPTDLVHEAYLRLSALRMGFVDRQHFIRQASTEMRRILVDHARRKQSQKRGERAERVTLRTADLPSGDGLRVVELDLLLNDLARADPRKAKIAELHYFGGFTQDETAAALEISAATVVRELRFLRGWIVAQLGTSAASP
ncbi:MAG: ECF-type sigma factor [Lysobacterales bacterium]